MHERFSFLDHRSTAFLGGLRERSSAVGAAKSHYRVPRGCRLQGPKAGGPWLDEASTKVGEALLLPKPGPSGLGDRASFGSGEEES